MNAKTLQVAIREYKSTVMTKAFIFSAFIFPAIVWGLAIAIPMLVKDETPQLKGTIKVIDETGVDRSGWTVDFLRQEFDPATIQAQVDQFRQMMDAREHAEKEGREVKKEPPKTEQEIQMALAARFLDDFMEQPIPDVAIEQLPTPATPEEREALFETLREEVRRNETTAFITLGSAALEAGREGEIVIYGDERMHANNLTRIQLAVSEAVAKSRLSAQGLDPNTTRLSTMPPSVETRTVTEKGESEANELANMFVPFGFMMLLWISTFTGGQYLLTTTIEEKSSKVIEVLLSATSPMQLMTGKILGQGAVALTMLAVYVAMATGALDRFGMSELIEPEQFVVVVPFFLMAFFFVACMMASIGSAVNDMREAQSLMGPAMMVLMLPLLAWVPIVRNPNGVFATVASFIPPVTPFVMALRLGSNQPIASWQIAATIAIGSVAVVVGLWMTAKIFRIGILMHGKAPNVMTLLRWVRQA